MVTVIANIATDHLWLGTYTTSQVRGDAFLQDAFQMSFAVLLI